MDSGPWELRKLDLRPRLIFRFIMFLKTIEHLAVCLMSVFFCLSRLASLTSMIRLKTFFFCLSQNCMQVYSKTRFSQVYRINSKWPASVGWTFKIGLCFKTGIGFPTVYLGEPIMKIRTHLDEFGFWVYRSWNRKLFKKY